MMLVRLYRQVTKDSLFSPVWRRVEDGQILDLKKKISLSEHFVLLLEDKNQMGSGENEVDYS